MPPLRYGIRVRGVVQGVGFRPFVYREALGRGLSGFVYNDADGVYIEAEGPRPELDAFVEALRNSHPPLARISEIETKETEPLDSGGFEIRPSPAGETPMTLVSPDLATCENCLRELLDTSDRRYLYPFINCTDCGPRYTIIRALPYDRPNTTMKDFPMCPDCRAEYDEPLDRRFHAQPVACPAKGPHVWLADAKGNQKAKGGDALLQAASALSEGRILAIKGLGGFHLAVDASNDDAVQRLRRRKNREMKPLALMCRDVDAIRQLVELDDDSLELLRSYHAPIVLLPRLDGAPVSRHIAPGQPRLGVMLPYTPLHHILLKHSPPVLVMTSGNLSEEPIAHDNDDALERLAEIADLFLLHNRGIHIRVDDSVVARRSFGFTSSRRARGFAPLPVPLPCPFPEVLALGPHLKNTICYIRGRDAFMSHHIGDLENARALSAFRQAIDHLALLYEFEPKALACDLHPSYASTREAERLAEERGLPLYRIQHHHAHGLAVAAEKGIEGPFITVAWDGTGYGTDGAIWGMEFLKVEGRRFERLAHLRYMPVAGGDRTIRSPRRTAFFTLAAYLGDDKALEWAPRLGFGKKEARQLLKAAGSSAAVSVGSCGRLFDAVSALCGVCSEAVYEAQAAIELEAAIKGDWEAASPYPLPFEKAGDGFVLDAGPLLEGVLNDIKADEPIGLISLRFHKSLVAACAEVVSHLVEQHDGLPVVLTGGCFQNSVLIERARAALEEIGADVIIPSEFPVNDGSVSLGQAVAAAMLLEEQGA